jgi:hypothetical protein
LIDNPIAAREQAGAAICPDLFHVGDTTVGAFSE